MTEPIARTADPAEIERRVFAALLDASDWIGDFPDLLVKAVAAVAATTGRDLTAGRPGSWESAIVRDIVQSAGVSQFPELYRRDDPRTQP